MLSFQKLIQYNEVTFRKTNKYPKYEWEAPTLVKLVNDRLSRYFSRSTNSFFTLLKEYF